MEDIKGKKIQITVPEGYDFVQKGKTCYFIEKKVSTAGVVTFTVFLGALPSVFLSKN
jgi:hypothetical protein